MSGSMDGMARRSEARYTTITAPAGTDYGTLNKLAAENAIKISHTPVWTDRVD
jgi:hypothetical protein